MIQNDSNYETNDTYFYIFCRLLDACRILR